MTSIFFFFITSVTKNSSNICYCIQTLLELLICIKLAKANFFFEKIVSSPNFGFFQNFLALFDTFTTRYNHSDIKFEFSGYFYPYEHFIKKYYLKNIQKCPSDLCALWISCAQYNWAGWSHYGLKFSCACVWQVIHQTFFKLQKCDYQTKTLWKHICIKWNQDSSPNSFDLIVLGMGAWPE